MADRLDIPVYLGANRPLEVAYTSAQDTHGDDGLGNSQIPAVTAVRPIQDAAGFIEETLIEARVRSSPVWGWEVMTILWVAGLYGLMS
ncbi:hypothetical protein WP50_22880 [Lactiplantibacillus plantarum]|nr:hypothetical protein WP50_22880 [Lactiplantibacillus plantarum]